MKQAWRGTHAGSREQHRLRSNRTQRLSYRGGMTRAAWCGALLAAASALAFACSSFGGGDDPASTPDASALDSGAPLHSASPGDSATVDASSVPFCASLSPKPTFCVDFDEGDPAPTGFDEQLGTVSLDSRLSFSPPSSLSASTLDGGGGANAISYLGRSVTAGTTTQRLSFMIRLGDEDGGALPAAPYGIVARLNTNDCELDIDVASGGLGYLDIRHRLADGGATGARPVLLRRPPPGKWTSVELRLSAPAPGNLHAELDIGGQPAIDPFTSACVGLGASPRFFVGLIYTNNAVVRYDNVVFDAK